MTETSFHYRSYHLFQICGDQGKFLLYELVAVKPTVVYAIPMQLSQFLRNLHMPQNGKSVNIDRFAQATMVLAKLS